MINGLNDVYSDNAYHFHLLLMESAFALNLNYQCGRITVSGGKPSFNSLLSEDVGNVKRLEYGLSFDCDTHKYKNMEMFTFFAYRKKTQTVLHEQRKIIIKVKFLVADEFNKLIFTSQSTEFFYNFKLGTINKKIKNLQVLFICQLIT
ncbi:hypothetical protein BpHYR1_032203 [Brachionus plicatilis]|uniref:Uncharacterized protein n=1 Tax=Brachionus plicatilis TaxID=10195 RepID=A0A3M7Q6Q8_BRAPC|nr:hypothetical protein BpHYR1_032203 [Brachionus plicatilis]